MATIPRSGATLWAFCLRLVAEANAVVFSRVLGRVTSGVGKEVNQALRPCKPVFEVAAGKVVRPRGRVAYITRRETLSLYEKWRL